MGDGGVLESQLPEPLLGRPAYGTEQQKMEDYFLLFIFEKYVLPILRPVAVFVSVGPRVYSAELSRISTFTLNTSSPLLDRASSSSLLATLLDTRFASSYGKGVHFWSTPTPACLLKLALQFAKVSGGSRHLNGLGLVHLK